MIKGATLHLQKHFNEQKTHASERRNNFLFVKQEVNHIRLSKNHEGLKKLPELVITIFNKTSPLLIRVYLLSKQPPTQYLLSEHYVGYYTRNIKQNAANSIFLPFIVMEFILQVARVFSSPYSRCHENFMTLD